MNLNSIWLVMLILLALAGCPGRNPIDPQSTSANDTVAPSLSDVVSEEIKGYGDTSAEQDIEADGVPDDATADAARDIHDDSIRRSPDGLIDSLHDMEVGDGNAIYPDSEGSVDVDAADSDAVQPPTDVSLVTDCAVPQPYLDILTEAKAKGMLGYVYVVGGVSQDFDAKKSATVQRLNLSNGQWELDGLMPEIRYEGFAVWTLDTIWLFAGDSFSAAIYPGDGWAGEYSSACGKIECPFGYRRKFGSDSWTKVPFDLAGGGGHFGSHGAGCAMITAQGPVEVYDAETAKVENTYSVPAKAYAYQYALTPWSSGFAYVQGFAKSNDPTVPADPIFLLDASGKPTGETIPAPPCKVKTPQAWTEGGLLFVVDAGAITTKGALCSGQVSPPAGSPGNVPGHMQPVAWDGSAWKPMPLVPGQVGDHFIHTPVGVLLVASETHNGLMLQSPVSNSGIAWMDPKTYEWSDSKYPPFAIGKGGVAATWSPK